VKPDVETSNQYAHPRRPWPIRALNGLGPVLRSVGALRPIEAEALLAEARRKTGLGDFGDDAFREPLRVLIDSLNQEAQLTPLGHLIQRGRLVSALVGRLRAEELCKQHPEILDIDLGQVIVIAGLQRTGTTMLHRLLAADPGMRALISWEALNPLPLPGEKPGQPTARIRQGRIAERGLAYLAPEFFAIHPVEHDAPEEDVLLLDMSFMSQSPEATMHVPTYAAWVEKQDNGPAYRYMRKLMQILLWQTPARSWVLKSPHHMEYLDTVLDVFPEAKIVQTHRDPRKTTGSFCSMVAHGRGVFSNAVDPKEVAEHWVRKVRRLMEVSIATREQRAERGGEGVDEGAFIDVSYYDLLKDPIAEVARIYDFAGIDFDAGVESAARAMTQRNVQNKYGRHRYRLEDFGLSNESIDFEFAFYRKRYDIPFE